MSALPWHSHGLYRCDVAEPSPPVEITGRFVKPRDDSGWARTGEETAVPTRIEATVYLADPLVRVDMLVNVDWSARATVHQLTVVTDSPQTPVTTRMLRRIPIDYLLRFVLEESTVKARPRTDISPRAFQVPGDPDTHAWVSGGPPTPGRGKNTPEDRVARAAEIYKQALAGGSRAPGEVVATQIGYSRATAARDIRAARRRGLLPPLGQEVPPPVDAAITGTGSITRMPADEWDKAAQELGVQGPGPKGKRLAEMTQEEFEELAVRLGALERPSDETVEHPGVPLDDDAE